MLLTPENSIPTGKATSQDWITWYKALKAYYSKKEARFLFLRAWEKRGNSSANDDALRNFLKKEGIDLEADFSDLEWATNPFGIKDFFTDVANVGLIVAAIILVMVFVLAYNLSKRTNLTVPVI